MRKKRDTEREKKTAVHALPTITFGESTELFPPTLYSLLSCMKTILFFLYIFLFFLRLLSLLFPVFLVCLSVYVCVAN